MKSLLIVEDEKMIRHGISAIVKRAPVAIGEVIECRNGAEAMEILRGRHIDVMLTDIRMPKMDGVELVRLARELPSPPEIAVISGHSDFNYAVSTFRQGVRDYITKPIDRRQIYELLAKLQAEFDAKEREKERGGAANRLAPSPQIPGGDIGEAELRDLGEGLDKRIALKIGAAIEFVGGNFSSDIDMAIVSNHISMNYTQFSTSFKKHAGVHFQNYLRDIRLAESMRLLAGDPAMSIKEISEASGFRSAKHFMRCFKQKTGMPPSLYRRFAQKNPPGG
jgi:YesN/AraC family two-component response regulator